MGPPVFCGRRRLRAHLVAPGESRLRAPTQTSDWPARSFWLTTRGVVDERYSERLDICAAIGLTGGGMSAIAMLSSLRAES